MLNGRNRPFIGLGRNVEIGWATHCFGWKHSRPRMYGGIGTQGLAPIQIARPNGAPPTIQSLADDLALNQWAPDSFDMVVIHVPPPESVSDTYKQLIRVARQGLILLGATRS